MSKFSDKIKTFWMFNLQNPVVRKGETGGFKWTFRRYWLTIETVSGNFKARFTAAEHPYGYLLMGKDDKNIEGFCQMLYATGMLLTTDQGLVNDINKAFQKYDKRSTPKTVEEDEGEEIAAIKEVRAVQEHIELPKAERKKRERDINGRFKKAVKDVQKGSDSDV